MTEEIQYLVGRVLAREDAQEALEYILSEPVGGPSCGCGGRHWECNEDFTEDGE